MDIFDIAMAAKMAKGSGTPQFPAYPNLVYTYTYTLNKEVHPTAVDIATGVWTAEGHGLEQGKGVFISVHPPYNILDPYNYIPGGLLLGEVGKRTKTYYVNVIDEDHFTLGATNGGEALTYTEVATMDLSKFHIEKPVTVGTYNTFQITGLPKGRDFMLVLKGRMWERYRYFTPTSDGKYGERWDASLGYNDGWDSYQVYLEFHMEEDGHVVQRYKSDALVFSETNARTVNNVAETSKQHYILPDNYIDGFLFNNGGGFYNGTTVEVYGK